MTSSLDVVLQSERAECALACLAMIARAHGGVGDLAALRRRFPLGAGGAALDQLIDCAARLGLTGRAVRLPLSSLGQLAMPCVLHWDMDHFVVLKAVRRRHVVVLDPAAGERRLTLEEVSRHFTGVALELTPTVAFRREPPAPALAWTELTGRVRGLPGALLRIFAVALVLELFAVVGPLFNQLVVDEAIAAGDRELLPVLVLGFGLLMLVQSLIGLARSWMVTVLGQTILMQWRVNLFTHLLRLPVEFFERRHLGDIVSRFGSLDAVRRTVTDQALEAVLDGLMASVALLMMLIYAPRLAALTGVAVGLYALLRWVGYGPLRRAAAEQLVLDAREQSHFLETLRAIQPVKLFGREQTRRADWHNLLVQVQNREFRTVRLQLLLQCAHALVMGTEQLLVYGWGAALVLDSSRAAPGDGGTPFTLGMLLAFISYKTQFSSRVSALIDFGVDWRMLRLHAERLADIALTPPEATLETDDVAAMATVSRLPASLALRNVSFRHGEHQPWVLRHVTLTLAEGDHVAIVGPSGAGKTTLLKLLLGLLPPTEGEVLFGGQPMSRLSLPAVRRQIGTVMQEDVLMSGSVAENISCFDLRPDQERIEHCARLAQIHQDIVAMPMGYFSLVGDLGTGLSGGQRQRLLLARALYKQPRLLALDEATSHLDLNNERRVGEALRSLAMTRLVIAHRPESIAMASRVWVVADGRVVDRPPEAAQRDDGPGA